MSNAPHMELTFLTSNPGTRTNLKRCQACESCRKRKKRCHHVERESSPESDTKPYKAPTSADRQTHSRSASRTTFSEPDTHTHTPSTISSTLPRPTPPSYNSLLSPHQADRPDLNHANQNNSDTRTVSADSNRNGLAVPEPPRILSPNGSGTTPPGPGAPHQSPVWRFVGDMSPATLFQRQPEGSSAGPAVASQPVGGQNEMGVWQTHAPEPSTRIIPPPPRPLALVLPPLADRLALIDLYFTRINHILPIIDETVFRNSSASSSTVLIQSICLVAAKDRNAKRHLRLDDNPELLSLKVFCRRLEIAIDIAIRDRFETNKMTLIRALALSSLHVDGVDGAEEGSLQLMQAIHHSHTMGLHLDFVRADMKDDSPDDLWWSLWSLDRLNACINGRPIVIGNHDLGQQVQDASRAHHGDPFSVWLRIADMADKVIEFYRPVKELPTGWEEDFPGFEGLVRECDALNLPAETLQTLELFYHAVAILSSRSRSFKTPPKATPSTVRQALSAISVTSIIQEQPLVDLLPLPVVPYSVSLALSVAYRHVRQTGLTTNRIQAKAQLQLCCELLEKLGQNWWSAAAMSTLGRRALNEANKSINITHTSSPRRNSRPPPSQDIKSPLPKSPLFKSPLSHTLNHEYMPSPKPLLMPPQHHLPHPHAQADPHGYPNLPPPPSLISPQHAQTHHLQVPDLRHPSQQIIHPHPHSIAEQQTPLSTLSAMAVSIPDVANSNMQLGGAGAVGVQVPGQGQGQAADTTGWGDTFGESPLHFDPSFDAAFGNYLNVNLPTNFGDPLFDGGGSFYLLE